LNWFLSLPVLLFWTPSCHSERQRRILPSRCHSEWSEAKWRIFSVDV